MSESTISAAADTIFKALAANSQSAFKSVVIDINKHVLPTMAQISRSLATIGIQLADDTITRPMADIEVRMAVRAAASVIVGFANTVLTAIENIINGVLAAVRDVVNAAVRVPLL